MIKELLKLSKHTVIYGFGQVATRGVAVLLIPLYTAYLSTEDYGVLQISRVYNSLLLTLLLLGMSTSMFRVYFKTEDESERSLITSTTFISYTFFSLIIFTPLVLILSKFSNFLINIPDSSRILWLVFLSAFLEGFFTLQLAVLRAEEKSKTYSIISLIKVIVYIGLIILFVVHYKKNYIGVIQAGIVSLIIIDLALVPITLANFKFKISFPYLKEILSIGIPVAISLLGAWILNLSDRYMIQYLMPESVALSQVGIYSLGDKLAQIIRFVLVMPFMLTWGAMMYKYAEKPNAKLIYRTVLHIYFYLACIIGLFLSLFSKEIIQFISQNVDYNSAYRVVPLLSFSKILTGVIFIISVGVILTNKTKYVAIASFIAAILNVIFNYVLIPRFGIMGASSGSLIAYIINVIILFNFAQKVYNVNYGISRIIIFGTIMLAFSFVSSILEVSIIIKILIFFFILFLSPLSKLISYRNVCNGLSYIKKQKFQGMVD